MHTPTATRRTFLRTTLAACALACLAAAPQAGAWTWGGSDTVQGNGNIKHQARAPGHFTGLALSLPGTVEVRSGSGTEGVTIETDDNLLPLIETVVEDGTLKLRSKRGTNVRTRNLKIVVQARELDRLSLGGSGTIVADALRGSRLKFDIGGSGSIKVGRIEGESASINLGGSGDLKAGEGSVRSVSVSVGGSGTVDMARVRTENASITVAGSGDATLWVRDALSLTVAGSGDVGYYGDPRITTSIVGSGKVKRLGAAPQ
jgi:hypothetical protein